MKVNALKLKNWLNNQTTPFAWQRVIVQVLPDLRKLGRTLADLEDPRKDVFLTEKELDLINKGAMELYQVAIPKEDFLVTT